jgi:hypothetical protein
VEWATADGEVATWYHIFYTDDGGGPGETSAHEGLALEAILSVDIPDDSNGDIGNSPGAHTKPYVTAVQEIEVHVGPDAATGILWSKVAVSVGSPIIDRATPDGASNIQFVDMDMTMHKVGPSLCLNAGKRSTRVLC